MPDWSDRYPRNVAGAFYVDTQCTDCDLCQATAPMVFCRDNDAGNSYVAAQPDTPDEFRLAMKAAQECPCYAIGYDGKPPDPKFLEWLKAAELTEAPAEPRNHGAGCRCHSQPEIASTPKRTRGRLYATAFGAMNIVMGFVLGLLALANFSLGDELSVAARIRSTVALVMGCAYVVSGALLVAGWRLGRVFTLLAAVLSLVVLVPMGVRALDEPGWSWDRLIPLGLAAYWIVGCVLVFRSRVRSSSQA